MQIHNLDKGILSAIIVASLVAAAMPAHFASATSQSENGKIVFVSNRGDDHNIYDIFVMNPDGSGVTKLTNGTLSTFSMQPKWSPDGSKIAFVGRPVGGEPDSQEVFVMNADGTQTRQLTHVNYSIYDMQWSADGQKIIFESAKDSGSQIYHTQIYAVNVAEGKSSQVNLSNDNWDSYSAKISPDGTKIVFVSYRNGTELFVMNADGTGGVKQLTYANTNPSAPDWSPDGSKIAFSTSRNESQIYVMNADGTEPRALLSKPISAGNPEYSPDGTKIAFISGRSDPAFHMHIITNLFAMNADGSELLQLTNHTGSDGGRVSWSPDSTKLAFSTQRADKPDFEIHTVNVDGTDEANITNNSAADVVGDWGVTPYSQPTQNSTLTINAVSQDDGQVLHVYTKILSADGTVLKRGFTPMNFTGNVGTNYAVSVANYLARDFDHWDNNSTDRTRTIDLSASNAVVTAFYDTSSSKSGYTQLTYDDTAAEKPTLTVNATSIGGSGNDLNMWTIIKLQDTNETAGNNSTTYTVAASSYGEKVFEHWEDGSTHRKRTLSIEENATITAYYKIKNAADTAVSFSAHWHDEAGAGTPVCDDVISGSCGPYIGNASRTDGAVTGGWHQDMPRGAQCSNAGSFQELTTDGSTFELVGTYEGTCGDHESGTPVVVKGECGPNSEISFAIGGGENRFIGESSCSVL